MKVGIAISSRFRGVFGRIIRTPSLLSLAFSEEVYDCARLIPMVGIDGAPPHHPPFLALFGNGWYFVPFPFLYDPQLYDLLLYDGGTNEGNR